MWDLEVDVACIGAGIGGVANAIATVDSGGEALIVDTGSDGVGSDVARGALLERVHVRRGWLVQNAVDQETDEYFAAVVEGAVERTDSSNPATVHVRDARNLTSDEAFGAVEPFRGSRLSNWASQCLASPHGLMYTSMRDWRSTTMRSSGGELVEVFSLGAMEQTDGEYAVQRWMTEQALDRDIEVRTGSTLHRLVFEDGVILGVELSTPDGLLAVRTRAGVTFAPRPLESESHGTAEHGAGGRLQVCLVGRNASRFARVELLTTEPTMAPRPTCTGSRRQYREGMHDVRQPSSDGWRCGKVNGYPPLV